MMQYELVLHSTTSDARRFPVNGSGLVLGRSADADITIDEGSVSRLHVRVSVDDGALTLHYLGSRNGIRLNGERVRTARLHAGDRFTVGECVLIVAKMEGAAGEPAGNGTAKQADGATPARGTDAPQVSPDEQAAFAKVSSIYRAAASLDDFLQKALAMVMDSVHAQRGFVFGKPGEDGVDPKMLAFHSSYADNNPDGPILNRYTVEKVLGQADARYSTNGRKSSRSNGRGQLDEGTMCVPLLGKRQCFGVLYVDSPKKSPKFSKGEFEQIIALGRFTGLAVEKAKS